MIKMSRQKSKYLENEKSFWGQIKSIFHNFKGFSVAEKGVGPESAPLRRIMSLTDLINRLKDANKGTLKFLSGGGHVFGLYKTTT